MPKSDLTLTVEPQCRRLAESQGLELVDVCLDKEGAGKFLRIYVDKPEGITLDDCERYHRAVIPLTEHVDYDFLEVSSPGVDRPLKKDRDYERALGEEIEVRLFRALDGRKTLTGVLADFSADELTLNADGRELRIPRKAVALARPVVDMSGVEEVEFPEE